MTVQVTVKTLGRGRAEHGGEQGVYGKRPGRNARLRTSGFP